MVADRLMHLLGNSALENVNRILDIGSWHLGQSIEFADIFVNAKIDAFEPVPDSYHLCSDRLSKLSEQKRKRMRVHNLALSNAAGDIPFYPIDSKLSSDENIGASSMFKFIDGLNGTPFGQSLVQQEIVVASTTLDEWCEENGIDTVDIMWLDVQGAELLVFQGAKNILKRTSIIMTEVGLKPYYRGHTLKTDIDSFLFDLGFAELKHAFNISVRDYEANAIYVRT